MVSAKPYFEEPTPVYDTLDVSVHHVPVNFAEAEAELGQMKYQDGVDRGYTNAGNIARTRHN